MHKFFGSGKYYVAFHKFPKTAKEVSKTYNSGFHKWGDYEDVNYAIVVGLFRAILSINKNVGECSE